MKKHSMILISAAALLTVGCGTVEKGTSSKDVLGSSSSQELIQSSNESAIQSSDSAQSSSSSVDDKHASFEDFASLLESAANKEAFTCHAETMKDVSIAGSIKDIVTKDLTITADNYSLAKGTFQEYLGDTLSISDNITEIRSVNEFRYKIDERDYKTNMFYSITDFEKDLSPKYDYRDSAYRQYVVHSALDIGDLSEGTYMFDDEAEYALSFKNTTYLLNFVDSYFYSNPYAGQVGCIAMDKEVLDKDTVKYSASCKYELEGDLNDIQKIEISMSATFDEKGKRLVSFATSYVEDDINKAHADDHRITSLTKEGTLKYDDRRNKAKDAPKAEDYFLAKVDSVELLGTDRSVIDATKVSPANSYIFLQPKDYSPAKTIGINEFTISPESSSNEKVVMVEKTSSGNRFIVKGEGTATLTYSYVGIDDEGYYQTIYKTYDVYVREYEEPTKISAASIFDDKTGDIIDKVDGKANVEINGSYHFIVNVVNDKNSSSKVPQDINVELSDESMISWQFVDRVFSFTALKEGEVTLKISSKDKPEVSWSITLVIHDNSSVDVVALLVANKWKYTSIYSSGYYTMSFNRDGTGNFLEVTSEGKEYNETFKWKYEDDKLTTWDWSYDYKMFNEGTLNADYSALHFYYEATFKTYEFVKVA